MTQRRSIIEHSRDERQQQRKWSRSDRIQETIAQCSRALGDAGEPHESGGAKEYRYVEQACRVGLNGRGSLADLLRAQTGREPATYAGLDLDRFDVVAVDRLLSGYTQGFRGKDAGLRQVVLDAFKSLVAIAEFEGIVQESYEDRVDVLGLATKLGEWKQEEQMYVGDPVYGVSLQSGSLKTLWAGETGFAKTAGLAKSLEDYYQYPTDLSEHEIGTGVAESMKAIDLVDLENGETWAYDIPQQQDELREKREKMGLAPDFTEADHLKEPEIMVYAPLTGQLVGQDLPYDTESDAWTVRPFTIPTHTITEKVLLPALSARVSEKEGREISRAYDKVTTERSDWAFKHLVDEIRTREDISDANKRAAIDVLQDLQRMGFIRTDRDEHTLEWRRIFKDTNTITVFSQAFVDRRQSEFGQLFVIAWLVDRIISLRGQRGWRGLPDVFIKASELWEIVPHAKRSSSDARSKAMKAAIAQLLERGLRKERKFGIHWGCDTQYPGDLKKSIREAFNRYVVYTGSRSTVKDIVEWTQNNKKRVFWGTMTSKVGEAGIIGQIGPAIKHKDIEFASPVSIAPPAFHHYDKDSIEDITGPEMRVNRLQHEELREPEWDPTPPDRLLIETYDPSAGDEEDDEDDNSGGIEDVSDAHRIEARNRNRQGESVRQIRENIPNNPGTGDPYSISHIQTWIEDVNKGGALDD